MTEEQLKATLDERDQKIVEQIELAVRKDATAPKVDEVVTELERKLAQYKEDLRKAQEDFDRKIAELRQQIPAIVRLAQQRGAL